MYSFVVITLWKGAKSAGQNWLTGISTNTHNGTKNTGLHTLVVKIVMYSFIVIITLCKGAKSFGRKTIWLAGILTSMHNAIIKTQAYTR